MYLIAVLLQEVAEIFADSAEIVSGGEVLSFAWNRIAPGSYTVNIYGDYGITKPGPSPSKCITHSNIREISG